MQGGLPFWRGMLRQEDREIGLPVCVFVLQDPLPACRQGSSVHTPPARKRVCTIANLKSTRPSWQSTRAKHAPHIIVGERISDLRSRSGETPWPRLSAPPSSTISEFEKVGDKHYSRSLDLTLLTKEIYNFFLQKP